MICLAWLFALLVIQKQSGCLIESHKPIQAKLTSFILSTLVLPKDCYDDQKFMTTFGIAKYNAIREKP